MESSTINSAFEKAYSANIYLGVTPGYNHNNENDYDIDSFCNKLQKDLDTISDKIDYYISFVVTKSKVVYRKEWGCPDGGESIFVLHTTLNTNYNVNYIKWKDAVCKYAECLKEMYKQSTLTIEFDKCETLHLK